MREFLLLAAFADAAPPVKLDGLPAAEFAKLGSGAELDYAGRVLTKSQLLVELETHEASRGEIVRAPKLMPRARRQRSRRGRERRRSRPSNAALRCGLAVDRAPSASKAASAAGQGGPRITTHRRSARSRDDGEIRHPRLGVRLRSRRDPSDRRSPGWAQVHVLTARSGGFALSAVDRAPADWSPGHALVTYQCVGVRDPEEAEWIAGIPDQQLQVVVVTRKGERSAPFPARVPRAPRASAGRACKVRRTRSNVRIRPRARAIRRLYVGTIACTAGAPSSGELAHRRRPDHRPKLRERLDRSIRRSSVTVSVRRTRFARWAMERQITEPRWASARRVRHFTQGRPYRQRDLWTVTVTVLDELTPFVGNSMPDRAAGRSRRAREPDCGPSRRG